jgi:hypothetical protein
MKFKLSEEDIFDLSKREQYIILLDWKKSRIGVKQIDFLIRYPDEVTHKHAQLADEDQTAWSPMKDKDELMEYLNDRPGVKSISLPEEKEEEDIIDIG